MIKLVSVLTSVLALGAIAVGLLSLPETNAAAANQGAVSHCTLQETALDEGYGVTRMALRPVCEDR